MKKRKLTSILRTRGLLLGPPLGFAFPFAPFFLPTSEVQMGAGASTEGITVCAEGDRVKVNFKGKGSWYNGSISRCNDNGTYEIAYACLRTCS